MNRKTFLLSVSASVLLGVLLMFSCGGPLSYPSFINQDKSYYKTIADACEQLRAKTPFRLLHGQHISPNEAFVPAVVRDLRPSYLVLTTNRVYLMIGEGRGAYGIAWECAAAPPRSCELRAYGEDAEKLLFTR